MSLEKLYSELSHFNFVYHSLAPLKNGSIHIIAKVLDPEGIHEVMKIKELADRYRLMTAWDGKDVAITRQ